MERSANPSWKGAGALGCWRAITLPNCRHTLLDYGPHLEGAGELIKAFSGYGPSERYSYLSPLRCNLGVRLVVFLTSSYDVVVVGGGLAGFSATISAAKRKAKTLIVYHRLAKAVPAEAEPGIEILGIGSKTIEAYREVAGFPPPVYAETYGFRFVSPYGRVVKVQRAEKPTGGTLMVSEAMEILVKKAGLWGAEVRRAEVTDFVKEGGRIKGVATDEGEVIPSKVVVGAWGYNPTLSRKAGLEPPVGNVKVAQTVVRLKRPSKDNLLFTWFTWKPAAERVEGFLMPLTEEKGVVAVGTPGNADPYSLLHKTINEHPFISKETERITEEVYRGVVAEGLVGKSYADGIMMVGDAAGHFRPLGGIGTVTALTFGKIAGEAASKAAAEGDTSEKRLAGYERLWREHPLTQKIVAGEPYAKWLRKADDEHLEGAFEKLKDKPVSGDFYVELIKAAQGDGS